MINILIVILLFVLLRIVLFKNIKQRKASNFNVAKEDIIIDIKDDDLIIDLEQDSSTDINTFDNDTR